MSATKPMTQRDARILQDLIEDLMEKRNHRDKLNKQLETAKKTVKDLQTTIDKTNDEIESLDARIACEETLELFNCPGVTGVEAEEFNSTSTTRTTSETTDQPTSETVPDYPEEPEITVQCHEVEGKEVLVLVRGDRERILPSEEAAKRLFTEAELKEFDDNKTMDDLYNATFQRAQAMSQEDLVALWNDLSTINGQVEDPEVVANVRGFLKPSNAETASVEDDAIDAETEPVEESTSEPTGEDTEEEWPAPVKFLRKPDGSYVLQADSRQKWLEPAIVHRIENGMGLAVEGTDGSYILSGKIENLTKAELEMLWASEYATPYQPTQSNVVGLASATKKRRGRKPGNNEATA